MVDEEGRETSPIRNVGQLRNIFQKKIELESQASVNFTNNRLSKSWSTLNEEIPTRERKQTDLSDMTKQASVQLNQPTPADPEKYEMPKPFKKMSMQVPRSLKLERNGTDIPGDEPHGHKHSDRKFSHSTPLSSQPTPTQTDWKDFDYLMTPTEEENAPGFFRTYSESSRRESRGIPTPRQPATICGASVFYAPLSLTLSPSQSVSEADPHCQSGLGLPAATTPVSESKPELTKKESRLKHQSSLKRQNTIRSSSKVMPDCPEISEAPEVKSVGDLIAQFQGQSQQRRMTVLANSSFTVDIPERNAAKYVTRQDSLPETYKRLSANIGSEKPADGEMQSGEKDEPDIIPEIPAEPKVFTISVGPTPLGKTQSPSETIPTPVILTSPVLEKASWASLPNVKASGILETISEKDRKIQEAMYEVVTNEQMFYKSMYIVYYHFYENLMKKFDYEDSKLAIPIKKFIFQNIDKFLSISDKLLGEFDGRQKDKVLVEPYFDILINFVDNLMVTPYKRYSVSKQRQEQELEHCCKDPDFAHALDMLNQDSCTGGLTLNAFLLKPVQHATRYSLLMEAVVKRLEESDPRYELAKKALGVTRSFAEMINNETNMMEYLFELTTVLAGLKDVPSNKREKVEEIFSEAKKGTNIRMFGKEISFSKSKKGGVNFKSTEKLALFCWGSYMLITRESEQSGQFHFECLTQDCEASDGLDIMTDMQIASFPKGLDLSKLLLLKSLPLAASQPLEKGACCLHLLHCSSVTKKKWKAAIAEMSKE